VLGDKFALYMIKRLPKETARVINSQKLEDRYLKTEIYTPTDVRKREKGSLFFLVEILNPWHPSAQIAELIVETVKQEFYRIDDRPAACFERAVKNLNQKLASLAEEGETSWVGNLNAIIAATSEDKVYLTFTGNAEAYLFRSEKISRISAQGSSGDDRYPFLELTNGKLQLGDRFVFANSDLFDYISLDTLRDLTKDEGAKKTAQYIKDVLGRERKETVNALIVKIGQAGPETQALPDVVYLDRSDETSQTKIVKGAKEFYQRNTPKTKKQVVKIGLLVTGWIEKANKFLGNFVLSSHQTTSEPEAKQPRGWDKYTGQSIKPEAEAKRSGTSNILQGVLKFIKAIDRKWMIVAAIILILAIGLGIYYSQRNNQEVSVSDQISEVQVMIDSAETKVALHQEKDAKEILLQAKEKTEQISDRPQIATELLALVNRIEMNLNKIDKVTKVDQVWKDLSELNQGQFQSKELISNTGLMFVANQEYGQLYQLRIKDKKVSQVGAIPQAGGKIDSLILPENLEQVVIITDQDLAYGYDLGSRKIKKVSISIDKTDGEQDWSSYIDNLYLIDKQAGAIWRYERGLIDYSSARPLLEDDRIKNARSMTVDGDIYVLKNSNRLVKYSIGEISTLKLKSLPTPDSSLVDPQVVYTTADIDHLYVVDNGHNRVIKYLKNNGRYIKQYRLPEAISDITIANSKLFILSESSKVFQTSL